MANWIGKAVAGFKKKGTEGKFSASAKRAGMDTEDFAEHEMASKKASPLMKKRAQFALNAIGSRLKKK